MPIVSGAYVAPTWQNNGPPPINASELQAMSDTIASNQNTKTNQTDIAPVFDATQTYNVGTYVICSGKLYRFTANHSGAWTDADAVAVKDAVAGAPSGTAGYAGLANLALYLFAPAGYGLGGLARQFASGDNIDTTTAGGFYYSSSTVASGLSGTVPFGTGTGFGLLVLPMGSNDKSAAQIAVKYPGQPSDTDEIKFRLIRNSTPRAWQTITLS